MAILSIQSSVAFGHVGNSAAVFPLQRLGHEVWPVDTVQFSNHTGYGDWCGQVFPVEHVRDVVAGLVARGVLSQCQAVLSGYLGDPSTGAAVMEAVAAVKAANPQVLYCCDPVIGDIGPGVFVRAGVAEFLSETAVPASDIVTPNHFELRYLTGRPVETLAEAAAAAAALRERGPRMVVVTSLRRGDAPADMVETMLATADGVWVVATPLLSFTAPLGGAGDALAALFLGHLLSGKAAAEALAVAVSGLYGVLARTHAVGQREMALVAAQDELVRPSLTFSARRVA